MTVEIMAKIDADLNITNTLDPECKNIWFPLGIKLGYNTVMTPSNTFVSTQGRMKYLTPIYMALQNSGQHNTAVEWFNANIDFYHPYAVAKLKKLLDISNMTMNVSKVSFDNSSKFLQ